MSAQLKIPGTDYCRHPPERIEEILSQGGSLLGARCRDCGNLYTRGTCDGCLADKWLAVVSGKGERFCNETCKKQTAAARAQGKRPPAGERRHRGRK